MPEEVNSSFQIKIYGDLERFNNVTSKARCRIFYKYGNRNGTYITDEFAEKLIATIPYTPVKGIYEGDDYTDHGKARNLGRIYGIVPQEPHFAWESHVDEDGVEREYACVDVILFTAIYQEAGEIINKAQSMELYDKSIEGEWQIIDGQKYFVFTEGCFLGLQVLGDEVEPCFEGAAFFSLYESLSNMIQKIQEYNLNLQNNQQGGELAMPTINYRISDNEKFNQLWSLLNSNYNEEGGYTVDYDICEVYDDYAVCKNYKEKCFERVYYSKCEDQIKVENVKKCYIVDVTEEEYAALEMVKKACGTYEAIEQTINEKTAENEELANKNSEFEAKITECETTIATLNTEKEELNTQYTAANELLAETQTTLTEAQESLATLNTEYTALVEYKKAIEKAEKEAVIASYTEMLDEEILAKYTENLDNYTSTELDKELAYELKNSNPNIFTKGDSSSFIPKDNQQLTGIEGILSKYKK